MTLRIYIPGSSGGAKGDPGPAGGPIPPGGTPGQYPTPDGSGGYTWATPSAGSGGGFVIFQNSDGSWPARTTVTSDRTKLVQWVGTLPGPVIGSGTSQAVSRLDLLYVTAVVPAA